jgi:hypothetical protein
MNYSRSTIISMIVFMTLIITLTPPVYSTELSASDKATEFLSSVVGIDLAKYNLTKPPSDTYSYPSELCGLIKEEVRSYKYEASGSNISSMSIFHNEQMVFFSVSTRGIPIYAEAQPSDILGQAKSLLQRYQAYVSQVYTYENSYLASMQNILDNVNDLTPKNITKGNMILQISHNGDYTRIQWIYSENGVSMRYKTLDLTFRKNIFDSFVDTWNFYKVGGFSIINSEEAYKLALITAQNSEFRIVNDKVNEAVQLPDLSKSGYQMYFTMLPYRNDPSHMPSKIIRDPLKLYPYWQFYFYFTGEEIGGYSGVQVGIWGDTKEIVYCNGFGFLGASAPTEEEQLPISAPSNQPSSEPPEQQAQPIYSNTLIIVGSISAAIVATILTLLLFARHRKTAKSP